MRVIRQTDDSLSNITSLLRRLRSLDTHRDVFGSSKHQYKNCPIPRDDINSFEHLHGIDLPKDFRSFLLDVGYGAGPYYGIWSLHEMQEEIDDVWRESEIDKNMQISPSSPFPLTQRDVVEYKEQLQTGAKQPWISQDYPCNGCIPICYGGCSEYVLLVTSGELFGTVWGMGNPFGYDGLWSPAKRPPGILSTKQYKELPRLSLLPTFREWYESWIERCCVDLELINTKGS
jgi:hypothetical protein